MALHCPHDKIMSLMGPSAEGPVYRSCSHFSILAHLSIPRPIILNSLWFQTCPATLHLLPLYILLPLYLLFSSNPSHSSIKMTATYPLDINLNSKTYSLISPNTSPYTIIYKLPVYRSVNCPSYSITSLDSTAPGAPLR